MMMYHPIKAGSKKISNSVLVWQKQSYLIIWASNVTLTVNTANQSSCMTLWPMMMHHHTKFGYERSYQVWLRKVIPSLVTKGSVVEEISSRWTLAGILSLSCDLDLDHKRAIESFHQIIQLMIMCYQTKFSCKRLSSAENISESHILIMWSVTMIFTLKTNLF